MRSLCGPPPTRPPGAGRQLVPPPLGPRAASPHHGLLWRLPSWKLAFPPSNQPLTPSVYSLIHFRCECHHRDRAVPSSFAIHNCPAPGDDCPSSVICQSALLSQRLPSCPVIPVVQIKHLRRGAGVILIRSNPNTAAARWEWRGGSQGPWCPNLPCPPDAERRHGHGVPRATGTEHAPGRTVLWLLVTEDPAWT